MIKIEKTEVFGWESAIRGMRNPFNSWDMSDSHYTCRDDFPEDLSKGSMAKFMATNPFTIGVKDLELMKKLTKGGSDHGKFLRMINVTCDITAPLYWYKEYDTYKVGTVANSCSTMHKLTHKKFELDDFSHDNLSGIWDDEDNCDGEHSNSVVFYNFEYGFTPIDLLGFTIEALNHYRKMFLETNDKKYWWYMIQLLPSSYNQKRTIQLNYEVLKNMYFARKNHKLDEWHSFCRWCEELPYFMEIIGERND